MTNLLLNGRFLGRPVTGVDRVAAELATALTKVGLPEQFQELLTLHPKKISQIQERSDVLLDSAIHVPSALPSQLWEQMTLSTAQPKNLLLSMCNIGPIFRRRQVVMMHDAQVFDTPDAYSRAFRTWYRIAQPVLGRCAQMVITVSEYSCSRLELHGVVPRGKTRVVPNGADHVLRHESDPSILTRNGLADNGYFLFVGSLAPHKNVERLVAAAAARKGLSRPLVIVGGSDASVYKGVGIEPSENLKILSRVNDGELRALYEGATALMLPSLTEGFGLPAVEAMTCGCPVVASTGGAIPEVCDGAAIMVDPFDINGWTAAMDRLAGNDALRHQLQTVGYLRARQFTWEEAAKTLRRHLSELPEDVMGRTTRWKQSAVTR